MVRSPPVSGVEPWLPSIPGGASNHFGFTWKVRSIMGFLGLSTLAWSGCRAKLATCVVLAALLGLGLSGCISARRAAEMEAAAASSSTLTGSPAVDFTLPNQDGESVSLAEKRGKWVVLYFYPKDGTPGCTCQAFEFTKTHSRFAQLEAEVFGVSPDTVASHKQVTDKFKLKVPLLADVDREVMTAYGAWLRHSWGGGRVVRSTVLIDPEGVVAYHWPEVIPEGHAERVRAKLAELKQARESAGR